MRQSLSIFSVLLLVVGLTGCRGKNELELYYPGDTKVWQTSDSEEMQKVSDSRPLVELETNKGRIVIELFDQEAPVSVANFLEYVNNGFYEGTIFHRVEPGMVIQGGGFTEDMERKETLPTIINEAGNGLRNNRGTIGAARTRDMNSANSQFYVNLVNNSGFNGDGVTSGYAVFGRVYEGMSVVDAIALEDTGTVSGLKNVPLEPVIILSARQVR
ncbi:peptidylprolyl isomerase [Oceanipulchritudo coccoides]|nr:peptidylprolyl isomerase [Oceanipulchritudo coccoides]